MTDRGGNIQRGGTQDVPQVAVQYIYLDFDGELTSYNGEILSLDTVEVQNSSLTEERIQNILAELNARYAGQNVVFVTQRPATADYSTIFVGKTTAFDQYGAFKGLAETIDEGNANKTDKAFVNLDTTATDTEIIATIAHETDHLLGTLDHGGEGLQAYAAHTIIGSGTTSTGVVVSSGDSLTIDFGGTVNSTVVSSGGSMELYSGGRAINTGIQSGGVLSLSYSNNSSNSYYTSMTFTAAGESSGTVGDLSIYANGSDSVTLTGETDNIHVRGDKLFITSGGTVKNSILETQTVFTEGASGSSLTIQGYASVYNAHLEDVIVTSEILHVTGSNSLIAGGEIAHSAGGVHLYDGAHASGIVISSGLMYVGNGAVASDTVIHAGGRMTLFHSGRAINTGIQSGGVLSLSNYNSNYYTSMFFTAAGESSGTVGDLSITHANGSNSVTLTGETDNIHVSGGKVFITSGGTVKNSILETETVFAEGASGSFLTIQGYASACNAHLEDVIITSKILHVGGSNSLIAGGEIAHSFGMVHLYDSASATGIVISAGSMSVKEGAVASDTVIHEGGKVYLQSGRIADTVLSGGEITWSGVNYNSMTFRAVKGQEGKAKVGDLSEEYLSYSSSVVTLAGESEKICVTGNGTLSVISGGIIKDSVLDIGTSFGAGARGSALTVGKEKYGTVHMLEDACLEDVLINSGYIGLSGYDTVIKNAEILSGCYMNVAAGIASGTVVSSGGSMLMFESGNAVNTFLHGGCVMVYPNPGNGGNLYFEANPEHIGTIGDLYILHGSSAGLAGETDNVSVTGDGTLFMTSGGILRDSLLDVVTYWSEGASGSSITVKKNIYVSDARLDSAVVEQGGIQILGSSASVNNTVMYNSTWMEVDSGGSAKNTTVYSGGSLYVDYGGTHTGTLFLQDGAICHVTGTIEFNIKGMTVNSSTLVNDLSLVTGTPSFTISADVNQQSGSYMLAGNAANFAQSSISITISEPENTHSKYSGTLTVNGNPLVLDGKSYTVSLVNDDLLLNVNTSAAVFIYSGSADIVSSGTVISGAKIGYYHGMRVSKGGWAADTEVEEGDINVYDGGTVKGTLLKNRGRLHTSGSAYVYDTIVSSGGHFCMASGFAYVSGTVVSSGGIMVVSCGKAVNTTLDGGEVIVSSYNSYPNNVFKSISFSQAGVSSGVIATLSFDGGNSAMIGEGETKNLRVSGTRDLVLTVTSGAVVKDSVFETTVQFVSGAIGSGLTISGKIGVTVSGSATLDDIVIENAKVSVRENGTTVNNAKIHSGGVFYMSPGANAHGTEVSSGGIVSALENANISDTMVLSGGSYSGVGRNINVAYGGRVSAENTVFTGRSGGMGYIEQITRNSSGMNFSGKMKNVEIGGSSVSISGVNFENVWINGLTELNSITGSGVLVTQDTNMTACDLENIVVSSAYVNVTSGNINNATIENKGAFFINDIDAVVQNITICSGGTVTGSGKGLENILIHEGGVLETATSVTAMAGTTGKIEYICGGVLEGGIRNVVFLGGEATFTSGASVNHIVVSSGTVRAERGAELSDVTVSGYLFLSDATVNTLYVGGPASNYMIGGKVSVAGPQGVVRSAFVQSNGALFVQTYARGEDIILSGGNLNVLSGTVSNTILSSGGVMSIGGGLANDTIVSSGGVMRIDYGTVNDTIVSSGGVMSIGSSGLANDTLVSSGGVMSIGSGGLANNTILSSGGVLHDGYSGTVTVAGNRQYASLGGVSFAGAGDLLLQGSNSGFAVEGISRVTVASNGTAESFVISGGVLEINESTGRINDVTVYGDSSGSASIVLSGAGAVVSNVTLAKRGSLLNSSGGVSGLNILEGGSVELHGRGGIFENVNIAERGSLTVRGYQMATYSNVHVSSMGAIYFSVISSGPSITDKVSDLYIHSGGYLNGFAFGEDKYISSVESNIVEIGENTAVSGRLMNISSGGVMRDVTVLRDASINIMDGGIASNTLLYGSLQINSGAAHKGSLLITSSGTVSAESGAEIDFTVSEQTLTDDYLINDLSRISGAPSYTVTVDGAMEHGVYKLAGKASSLASSGMVLGDENGSWGTITVNGDIFYRNDTGYRLFLENNNLHLQISNDFIAPDAPEIFADVKELTNGDVKITAVFADDSVLNECKIGDGIWKEYTGAILFSSNGTISFRSTDVFGNVSETATYNVGNIDKTPPVISIVCDDTSPYREEVHLTATASDENSTTLLYSTDGVEWYEYSRAVSVYSNRTVYFRAFDFAGNSTTSSYNVTNIGEAPVKITSSGRVVSKAGVVSGVAIAGGSNNSMHISSGGIANMTAVRSGGVIYISSGGAANSTTVSSGGVIYISSGGAANSTTVSSGGEITILSGGVANSTTASSRGKIYIERGGTANYTTIKSNGILSVSRGGTAKNTLVDSLGSMTIYSGGKANGTTINSYSEMCISRGGTATDITVSKFGWLSVASGASASGIYADPGAHLFVNVASNTYIQGRYNGSSFEMKDAHISGYTVYSNVCMDICSGAVACGTVIQSGGSMYISSGGIHRGYLRIVSGGMVSAYAGSIIDFALAGRTSESNYLISDLSRISGAPTYTITVEADQASGTYKLAQGADRFTGTVSIGDDIVGYGSISVNGGIFKHNGTDYQLVRSNGNLELLIGDLTPPEAPAAAANITTLTNQDVIITVRYSEDSVVKEYRIGESGEWQSYSEAFTVTDNNTIYFRAEDAAGNENSNQFVIDYIDKLAPTLEITGNATEWTNQDVVLTATASDGTIEYFNGSAWVETDSVTAVENGTYHFRVTDLAGNVSEKSVTVDKIDKVAPTLEISGNATAWTNKDVVLTATASDGTIEYFNGTEWVETDSVTAVENGTYHFRVTDLAGNVTEKSVTVDKIDKVAPTLEISGNATEWTNKGVVLSAVASDGTIEYFNGTEWVETDSVAAVENGTYHFRVTDLAGNVTEKSVTVDKIDKVAPTLEIAGNATEWTNKDVVLTATASDGTIEYFNGTEWVETDSATAVENGTYHFRVTDLAGNVTEKSVTVDKIDKVAPTLEITGNAADWTNKDVVLSAVASDGTIEYFNGTEWVETDSVTAAENGTYHFRVTDLAGNVTEKSVTVDKIDKVAPTLEISGNATAWTNQDVVLTATASDGTIEYFNGTEWGETDSVTAVENGTYHFRVTDLAGNVSEKSVTVDKIDKVAPTLEITGNAADWTNKDVILTATASDGTIEYFNGTEWVETDSVAAAENGTYHFRVTDLAGNVTEKSVTVDKIDKVAPTLEITGNATDWTNKDVILTATASDGTIEYFNGSAWVEGNSITATENGIFQFRVTDLAGNVTEKSVTVDKIDKVAPSVPVVTADVTEITAGNVTLTVETDKDTAALEYSYNSRTWYTCSGELVMSSNSSVYFRCTDLAGNQSVVRYVVDNIDKSAPGVPEDISITVNKNSVSADWSDVSDKGKAGVAGYLFRYGSSDHLTGTGISVTASAFEINDLAAGTWYYQVAAVDSVGNISNWSQISSFVILPAAPEDLVGSANGVSWKGVSDASTYVVEYSGNDFADSLQIATETTSLDTYNMPSGTYQWRVKADEGEFVNGETILSDNLFAPQKFVSDADGNMDLFFGKSSGIWESGYAAQHLGTLEGWGGTFEQVVLSGKNKLAHIFEGSTDANILILTDDSSGDALFVDDIYTALGEQARIAQINEIRAGAGDDIVDMTSQRYAYTGEGVKIYGGLGNDTIWANKGSNTLFGDGGNDRLVGGGGNDILAGGSGNDSMHGGGGSDIFTFGGAFGQDTVEQLAGGSVTLWFETGSESNWNPDTMTYTEGVNSVTVTGCVNVTLRFGSDAALPAGAFADAASEKIFEDKDSGMLA